MKKLLIAIGVAITVVVLVVAALALAMTNRYTAIFEFEAERNTTYYWMEIPGNPEVSYRQTSFMDYWFPAKGLTDPYYFKGYMTIWVNVTDSTGEIRGGSGYATWDDTEEIVDSINVKVKVNGLTPGEAVATITVAIHDTPYGTFPEKDRLAMWFMNLEVG